MRFPQCLYSCVELCQLLLCSLFIGNAHCRPSFSVLKLGENQERVEWQRPGCSRSCGFWSLIDRFIVKLAERIASEEYKTGFEKSCGPPASEDKHTWMAW